MFYTVYKTTNNINGKYYIGCHITKNPYDTYLGSGIALKEALQKYGRKNFTKEILYIFDNEQEMYDKEKELIVLNEQSYNLTLGGFGGWDHVNITDMHKGKNSSMHNPEIKRKCIERGKETRSKNKEFYDNISRQNFKLASEKNKGKKRPEHSEYMKTHSNFKELWNNRKEYCRDKRSSTYKLVSPEGIEYTTNRLQEFCKEHNLSYVVTWNISRTRKIPKIGKVKGWDCQKMKSAPWERRSYLRTVSS